jgi:hypothetical protein
MGGNLASPWRRFGATLPRFRATRVERLAKGVCFTESGVGFVGMRVSPFQWKTRVFALIVRRSVMLT